MIFPKAPLSETLLLQQSRYSFRVGTCCCKAKLQSLLHFLCEIHFGKMGNNQRVINSLGGEIY